MNKLIKAIFILMLPLFAAPSALGDDRAVDLGLTPSPVYSLWTNINRAVIAYAGVRSNDKEWLKKLNSMEPNKFYNKVPADVLELVDEFSTKLNEVDEDGSIHASDTLLDGKLPNLLASEDNRVTPSLVYLYSGQVLVNIAGDILHSSTTPIEISPFFVEYGFIGAPKTTSDVFGLVDLALRRLDEIVIRQKNDQLITGGGVQ